ncbi:annexin A10 isoform X1 [Lates japonicus]|uniref:Annexin n=1 Tax=Lates japonicus TaxID=270547 RepID=A0AAD3MEM9_LATJO|nr:annexin A10 isoform X1 [Lates japonicus]
MLECSPITPQPTRNLVQTFNTCVHQHVYASTSCGDGWCASLTSSCSSATFFLPLNKSSTVKMASRGTVKASGNFNASADAEVLYKAMKGLGTDEDAILELLTARSNAQRQEIKTTYKTLFGKDLIDDLKGELGGKFETLIVGLMTPPIAYDVTLLRNAIKGAGTDEKVLVEILASRTPQQVKDIIAGYRQEYDADLEEDVCGDTSGHFKRLLVILLQANRQQGIQEGMIESDAQVSQLFIAERLPLIVASDGEVWAAGYGSGTSCHRKYL